jgi:SAM-dependent methyltransferase
MMEIATDSWFLDWFNSPYYPILYRNRDHEEARAFMAQLMERLNIPKGARLLDLACGRGRHAFELHNMGYEVVGIDISEDSIKAAQKFETEGLEFFVHDMRKLYWAEHFDAVLNLFTSFGYFHSREDDQSTMNSVADSLTSNGLFILDFFNVHKVLVDMVSEEVRSIDGIQFMISRKLQGTVIEKSIRVLDGDTELFFKEEVDALTLPDFKVYLEQAGLQIEATYGSYALEEFDENTSERLIVIARKTHQWAI